jgi:UDP-N-acetylmuramate dehydrogenase
LQPKTPLDVANSVIKIRQSKLPDPAKIGNSGSFFKNPVISKLNFQKIQKKFPEAPNFQLPNSKIKIPAAWLIETLGFKGFKDGNVGVNKLQPLVLVNYGGGTGEQVLDLAQKIKTRVLEEFGIDLETEVNVV